MASYGYQQRPSSGPRSRYDFSDADEDYRSTYRPSRREQYNMYDDRGRVMGTRTYSQNEPRYMPNMALRAPSTSGAMIPYNPQQPVAMYESYSYDRRSSSSRSRQRSPERGRSRHSTERGSSVARERSRSQSRFSQMEDQAREALGKTFDTRSKGVGAGIVGALVGAAIGRRLGDRDDNHALAGAIIGGLGVNALENQIHRSRERRREDEEEEKRSSSRGGWRRSISRGRKE